MGFLRIRCIKPIFIEDRLCYSKKKIVAAHIGWVWRMMPRVQVYQARVPVLCKRID